MLYDSTEMRYLVINITDTESRMVVAGAWGREEWRVVIQ